MRALAIWGGFALLLLGLPLVFDSVLGLSVLNQMAIAIVFALSYNMLLGQGGMLSFGHAVYFGLGGFLAVHAMLLTENETLAIPLVLIPLAGGVCGLLAALFIGSFSTGRAGTAFAMISLGVAELLAASSLILVSFFGGEAGVSADRTFAPPFFGIDFAQDVQVYFLAAAWLFVSVLAMYLFTQTPAGRLANAVRDNPERAQFLGYSAQRVRLLSFVVAGFFAGIAGGLFAVNYEILTAENLNAASSGRVLLMAYIGGLGVFIGPVIGAVLLTLINSLLSHYTTLWMLYLGLLFVLTVMFLPRGLTGLLMLHRVPWQQGTLGLLIRPYTLTAIPGAGLVLSLVGLLELSQRESGTFVYLGIPLTAASPFSWLALLAVAVLAFLALRRTLPGLRAAWADATAQPARGTQEGDFP